jgi:hypothetical protein
VNLKWTILLAMAALCIGFFIGRATKPQSGLDEFVSVAEKNHLAWLITEETYDGHGSHVHAQLIKADTRMIWSNGDETFDLINQKPVGAQETAKEVIHKFRTTPGHQMEQHAAKAQPMVFDMNECVQDGTCVVDPTDSFYLATCTDAKGKPLRTDLPLTKQIVKCP